jgi:hypothetical protein
MLSDPSFVPRNSVVHREVVMAVAVTMKYARPRVSVRGYVTEFTGRFYV